MKKLTTSLVFFLMAFAASAQLTSPNTGVKWNLDSLVLYSGGVVTNVFGQYFITDSLTLMPNDTFVVASNETIRVADSAEIVLEGVALLNPPDSLVIRALDTSVYFPPIEIRNSSTIFQNVVLNYGGGIAIYDSSPLLFACTLRYNKDGTRGAINLFNSNAMIAFCGFYNNYSSAISAGANIANAPIIMFNHISKNVTYNGNKSQILLGATGADTAVIYGNHIEGFHDNAGGISVFPIGTANVIVDSNLIENNRYGIGMLTGGINSLITNNVIKNNDIQGSPMLGGSGLNFAGSSSNSSIVSYNEIYGNLWGITIQGTAKPNMGDLRAASYNVGQNEIYDNFNSSSGSLQEYAIFNNTPDSIWAQNNIWHQPDSAGVESIISHEVDDPSLGFVTFMPINIITSVDEAEAVSSISIYPNPAMESFTFDASSRKNSIEVKVLDITGKEVKNFTAGPRNKAVVEVNELKSGLYFIQWVENKQSFSRKLILK